MQAAGVKESNGNGLCFPNGNHTLQSKLGGNIPLAMCGNGANGSIMGPSDQASDVFTSYNGTFPYPGQGSLNIANPRYSAMYRNTLLRYSPTPEMQQLPPTPVYPGPASPMSVRSAAITSPYHTIRAQQQQQQQQYIQVGSWNSVVKNIFEKIIKY